MLTWSSLQHPLCKCCSLKPRFSSSFIQGSGSMTSLPRAQTLARRATDAQRTCWTQATGQGHGEMDDFRIGRCRWSKLDFKGFSMVWKIFFEGLALDFAKALFRMIEPSSLNPLKSSTCRLERSFITYTHFFWWRPRFFEFLCVRWVYSVVGSAKQASVQPTMKPWKAKRV